MKHFSHLFILSQCLISFTENGPEKSAAENLETTKDNSPDLKPTIPEIWI